MNVYKKRRPRKKKVEFSKGILIAVLITYFVGVVIGTIVVLDQAPDQLTALLPFIGAPTAVAIGFYAWKAKNENMNKYKPSESIATDGFEMEE